MERWKAFAIVAAVMAVAWWSYHAQMSSPPATAGLAMVDVRVPELSAVAERGQKLFEENCAVCHGANAAGQQGVAPPLVHIIYEPSHHADASFYRAASQGVRAHHWPFGNMPPVQGVSREEVTAIIAYVRELQRANGIN